ncbi:MAG: acetyl-CoA carboxylase carboxyltransferase subunit alpha [Candidatus Krumholzibacteria bacterium]|nr:acetyl-CoA carboxylase carboxyltransferase subunit alpha [Candidatus Krumholzibacteria bacterium]
MADVPRGPWLDFERPIVELEERIRTLEASAAVSGVDAAGEVADLRRKAARLSREIFSSLDPWQRVQLARHGRRPTTLDFIERLFSDFQPLHGDRQFRDDPAIVGGLARLDGRPVLVVGHQKGRDTRSNLQRNFGMAHPEGYRKALRLMQLGERFGRPVITLIDTPGAYPGLGAEERGQAEAIARNLREMAALHVPTVAVITGEGGSGGALALGVADRVYMLENAVYSVISPEGCAAILWRDAGKAPEAARAMKLTAGDAHLRRLIDGVIEEPVGGAHRDHDGAALAVKARLLDALAELTGMDAATLRSERLAKFLGMGEWTEGR